MGLANFIRTHEISIIEAWETFAETCKPAADAMNPAMLRDHIRQLLRFVADNMDAPQTEAERCEKSKGLGETASNYSVAENHGDMRITDGFNILQVHAEFRALRASVLKLWSDQWFKSSGEWVTPAAIIPDLMRFNEAIDQMVSESLSRYLNKQASPALPRKLG